MRPPSESDFAHPARCVVVADAGTARTFLTQIRADGKLQLVERAVLNNQGRPSPPHPGMAADTLPESKAAQPDGHASSRLRPHGEIERRFAREIAELIAETVKDWSDGVVVLAADAAMLGLIREIAQDALPRGVMLKSLARDYARLTAEELLQRLDLT